MKIYNSDRNIRYPEILKIILNKGKAIDILKKWFPQKQIVFTNYGRSAFELILDHYNIKNCKVMIPAFICPFFKTIFKRRNIAPIFIDVDLETWNISKETLKAGFDGGSKCLIINNMNGLPAPIEDFRPICKDILIIEDCAHALGAFHNKKRVGLFGDSAFFSTYKNIPTIKGGFVISNDLNRIIPRENLSFGILKKFFYYLGKNANHYRKFRGKINFNIKDNIFYDSEILAPNRLTAKLMDYYLINLDIDIKKRKIIAKHIKNNLKDLNLKFQKNIKNEHIYTYFSFLIPKNKSKIDILNSLQKQGIIARLIWGDTLEKAYGKESKNSKEISKRIISIPINKNYSNTDINKISNAIRYSLL